eukprot:129120_1
MAIDRSMNCFVFLLTLNILEITIADNLPNHCQNQSDVTYCMAGRPGLDYTRYYSRRYISFYFYNFSFSRCDFYNYPIFVNQSDHQIRITYNRISHFFQLESQSSIYAKCYASKLSECSENWIVVRQFYNQNKSDPSIYFGSDCNYALTEHWQNCADRGTYYDSDFRVTVDVAYNDSKALSGVYEIEKCYKDNIYYKKAISDMETNLFYSDGWFINQTIYNVSTKHAICSNLYYYDELWHTTCVITNYQQYIPFIPNSFMIDWIIFAIIYFLFFIMVCVWILYHYWQCVQGTLCPPPLRCLSEICFFKPSEIDVRIKELKDWMRRIDIPSTDLDDERTPSQNKDKLKKKCCQYRIFKTFYPKFIFYVVFKTALEAYDWYTDLMLSAQWRTGKYGLQPQSACLVTLTDYANALLWLSTIGFLVGIAGHFYFLYVTYFRHKKYLSYHSLTGMSRDNDERKCVTVANVFKLFVEDIPSIIICLTASREETIATPSTVWYLAYYSSCISLAVSVLLFIRKETTSKCAVLQISIGCCCGSLCITCLLVLIFPIIGFYHPSENIETVNMGFVTNLDNQCTIFEIKPLVNGMRVIDASQGLTVEINSTEFGEFHAECAFRNLVEKELLYMHCIVERALRSPYAGSSNSLTYSTMCGFDLFVNDCWSGNCSRITNMNACFGVINFQTA